MTELSDGEVYFFAAGEDNAVVLAHCAKGGRAVVARRGELVLAAGNTETRLAKLADIPALRQGEETFRLENTLAAVAAGWALNIPAELLAAGVKTFEQEAPAPSRRQKKN